MLVPLLTLCQFFKLAYIEQHDRIPEIQLWLLVVSVPQQNFQCPIWPVLTSCLSDDVGMRMASDRTLYIPATI